jgi:hypothetical protein
MWIRRDELLNGHLVSFLSSGPRVAAGDASRRRPVRAISPTGPDRTDRETTPQAARHDRSSDDERRPTIGLNCSTMLRGPLTPRSARSARPQRTRYIDVSSGCPRIKPGLVRAPYQLDSLCTVNPRRVEVERGCEPEAAAARRADADLQDPVDQGRHGRHQHQPPHSRRHLSPRGYVCVHGQSPRSSSRPQATHRLGRRIFSTFLAVPIRTMRDPTTNVATQALMSASACCITALPMRMRRGG